MEVNQIVLEFNSIKIIYIMNNITDILNKLESFEKVTEIPNNLKKNNNLYSNKLEDYLLPALQRNQDIIKYIYEDVFHKQDGLFNKVKFFILTKISNIVRNVIEKSIMKQQGFNSNTTEIILHLVQKNKELESRLSNLEKNQNNE
jgi:hypothetical protein